MDKEPLKAEAAQYEQYPQQQQQPASAGSSGRHHNHHHHQGPADGIVLGNVSQYRPGAGPSHWQTGLCECLSFLPSCCEVTWCSWCQIAHQYSMLQRGVPQFDPAICCVVFCFQECGAAIALTFINRQLLATRYNIHEDVITMAAVSLCCGPCATCQQHREMTQRGQFPGGVCASSPDTRLLPPQPQTMMKV